MDSVIRQIGSTPTQNCQAGILQPGNPCTALLRHGCNAQSHLEKWLLSFPPRLTEPLPNSRLPAEHHEPQYISGGSFCILSLALFSTYTMDVIRSLYIMKSPLNNVRQAPAHVNIVGTSCQMTNPHITLIGNEKYSNGATTEACARL